MVMLWDIPAIFESSIKHNILDGHACNKRQQQKKEHTNSVYFMTHLFPLRGTQTRPRYFFCSSVVFFNINIYISLLWSAHTFNACWHDEAKFAFHRRRRHRRPNMVRWMNSVYMIRVQDMKRNMIFYQRFFAMLLPYRYYNIVLKHVNLMLWLFFLSLAPCLSASGVVHFAALCVRGVGMPNLLLNRIVFSIFFVHLFLNAMANIANYNGRETQNKFFFSFFFFCGATHLCRVSCRIFFCFPSFVISIFFYLEHSYFSCYVIVMFLQLIQC